MNLHNVLQKERVTIETYKVSWEGAVDANFSVRNAYKVLTLRTNSLFPIKGVWVPSVPTKATFFFAWEVAWG